MVAPDPVDRVGAHLGDLSHSPAAPLRGAFRRGLDGCFDDGGNLGGADRWLSPTPGCDLRQRARAAGDVAVTPEDHCRAGRPEIMGDLVVGESVGGSENDPRTERNALRRVVCPHPGFEHPAVVSVEVKGCWLSPHGCRVGDIAICLAICRTHH
jgi:hypothetical protein